MEDEFDTLERELERREAEITALKAERDTLRQERDHYKDAEESEKVAYRMAADGREAAEGALITLRGQVEQLAVGYYCDRCQPEWSPTVNNINALPEPIRSYIHQLQTNCDPSGDTQERVIARDTCRSLELLLEARDQALAVLVEQWEEEAALFDEPTDDDRAVALMLRSCAARLRALLVSPSTPTRHRKNR